MFTTDDIKASLTCPCGNDKFTVCVSNKGALVVLCDPCKSVVAEIDELPIPIPECEHCKALEENDPSKLN